MSRCFPFPPPGYEKKARTGDVDLVKKEKQKEKKHKKEKKDKEKGENKEKKEKDRSDGKYKDRKDKKEEHKDKKKEKDREKERDRSNNSEKKFPGHPEGQNGEKALDEKKLTGKSEDHSGEKFVPKEKGRDKDRSSFSGEKKLAGQFSGYNGEKISHNSHPAEDFRDSKFVQELGRRVRDEGAGARNLLVDKFMCNNWKREEGMVRLVAKTANTLAEEKEKNKRSDDRKLDVQGTGEETRSAGNAMVQNLAGAVKARVEQIPRQVENNTERQEEGKEKNKEKESDDKIRDKRKDKDMENRGHGKDKDRGKEKKREEKAKAKGELRSLEQDNLKGSNKGAPLGTTVNLKTSHASKEGKKGAVAEENLCKRKDSEKNGFFHVNDIKPNKLLKTTSSYSLTDNGRTLESCQASIPLTSDSWGTRTSPKVDNKEHKVNGIIEAHLFSVSPSKHFSASAQASQIDGVCMKPPHPDSKYLSQVLSVPKMEEWSDFDDQEWLFHSNESHSKKLKVGFSEIEESPQVWAEALQIKSADVCALPYVIPY